MNIPVPYSSVFIDELMIINCFSELVDLKTAYFQKKGPRWAASPTKLSNKP